MKKKKSKKEEERIKREERKKQIESENNILRNLFIGIGVFILLIIIGILLFNSATSFNHGGVDYSVVKEGQIIFYNTKIPVTYQGKPTSYNFYLRNDPRELERKIPFDGKLILRDEMSVKITFNNYCQGYEIIAMENFLNLHRIAGINVASGENKTCDLTGQSMFVLVQESDRTYVEQTGPACYTIHIKECEILKGTERFMIETFSQIRKII